MSLKQMPAVKLPQRPKAYQVKVPEDIYDKWDGTPFAAVDSDDATITIYDEIGYNFWTGAGFTSKRMSAALRSIGNKAVTVKINSPGGDMFEGLAIYNMLRQHPAKVTVDVMGWAASAGSIIAMAADEINMGVGTFMMVHRAWGMIVGNEGDMLDGHELFKTFDSAITDVYEARTGMDRDEIYALMAAETFMTAKDAVANGFADGIDEGLSLPDDANNSADPSIMARREIEKSLAKSGKTRSERTKIMSDLGIQAARDAGHPSAERDAGVNPDAIMRLIQTMQK